MRQRLGFIISVIVFLALWEMLVLFGGISRLLIPTPVAVAGAVLQFFITPQGLAAVSFTFLRFIAGLVSGVTLGVIFGSLLGLIPTMRRVLFPWVDFFRSIPASAFIPLLLLLFGIGDAARLILIIIIVGLLMAVSTMMSLVNCSPTRRLVGKSLGLSRTQLFFSVVLPEVLPNLSTALRLAISFSLILTVLGEMSIGGSALGIGRIMQDAQLVYETPTLYAAIFVAGLLGYALNMGYACLEKNYIHWIGK
ncbi:MAG: ABC transporter permease subunit [Candidatus Magasanikbacteria bacterium]|nr:ABC transporter permease subunit [Candidatus Magasanikbacteria bacterium]